MEGVIVERLPIMELIMIFIFYIISHFGVGQYVKHIKILLEKNPNDEKLKTRNNTVKILFKWYPFIFVVGILLVYGLG